MGTDEPQRMERAAQTPDAPRRRRRWRRRLGITALVLLVLYTLGGFFGVPWVVTRMVAPRLSERLNGTLTIGGMDFNPFSLGVVLRDARVVDDAGEPIAGFARFEGNFNPIPSLFKGGWRFGHTRLFDPGASVVLEPDGTLNLSRIIKPRPEPSAAREPLRSIPRIIVEDLLVSGAAVAFRDLTHEPPFDRTIRDLAFKVDRLDTAPEHANTHTLRATLGEDASLDWTGTSYVDPLTTEGSIRIEGFDLAPFAPYARRFAEVDLRSGRASAELHYTLAPARSTERLVLKIDRVRLEELAVASEVGPLLALEQIDLAGIEGSLADQRLVVGSITVRGLDAHARRFEDGALELLHLVPEHSSGSTAALIDRGERVEIESIEYPVQRLLTGLRYLSQDVASAWTLDVQTLEVEDSRVAIDDAGARSPVSIVLTELAFSAGPMSSETLFATPFTVRAGVGEGGSLAVEGDLAPGEGRVDASVRAQSLDASTVAPYFPADLPEPLRGAELSRAVVALDGRMRAQATTEGYDFAWSGSTSLQDLVLSAPDGATPVALGSLVITGDLQAAASQDRSTATANWAGEASLEGAKAALATPDSREIAATLGSAQARGALDLALGTDSPRVQWQGALSLAQAEGALGQPTGRLDAGAATALVEGDARVDLGGPAPRLAWAGNAELSGGTAGIEGATPARVTVDRLRLGQGEVHTGSARPSLRAALVEITAPALEGVLSTPEQTAPTPEAEQSSGWKGVELPADIVVDRLVLTDGRFAIEDHTVQPPVTLVGSDLRVTAEGINSAGGSPMRLDVHTGLGDAGAATITGQADPFAAVPSLDLTVGVSDLPLPPLSPRAEPNLGYRIDRGRLTLALPVRVQEGQLSGTLDASLRSFFLGERVPSETATDLPIKLGLDLLRDPDDSINAKIGLSGDVTHPSFSLGNLIWKAIFNLIGNIATAPFKLIGELAGVGAEQDLSSVAFIPGTDRLAEGQATEIDALARALQKRPGLSLLVFGLTGPDDLAALRRTLLDDLVAERTRAGADERSALAALLAERAPPEDAAAVPVPPGRLPDQEMGLDAMRARVLATIQIGPEALADLAARRAQHVAGLLTESGGLAAERVRVVAGSPEAGGATPREGSMVAFEIGGG